MKKSKKKPNSSSKGSTTTQGKKIITRAMLKTLSPMQTIKLRDEGWQDEQPLSGDWKTEWKKQADAQGFVYKAPIFDPAKHLLSPEDSQNTDTYIAGMQTDPSPQLDALRADPDMQQIAASLGVGVDDLLLFREMMLDRFANRYQDPE
jgi:hypothetical protein